jgi:hypothetical protein
MQPAFCKWHDMVERCRHWIEAAFMFVAMTRPEAYPALPFITLKYTPWTYVRMSIRFNACAPYRLVLCILDLFAFCFAYLA